MAGKKLRAQKRGEGRCELRRHYHGSMYVHPMTVGSSQKRTILPLPLPDANIRDHPGDVLSVDSPPEFHTLSCRFRAQAAFLRSLLNHLQERGLALHRVDFGYQAKTANGSIDTHASWELALLTNGRIFFHCYVPKFGCIHFYHAALQKYTVYMLPWVSNELYQTRE